MHRPFACLLAAAVSGVAVTASAAAAPDQTLGVALMSAVVARNGTLVDGVGVNSVTKNGTGRYRVEFIENVQGCLRMAGIGVPDTFIESPLPQGFASTGLAGADGVSVQIRSTTNEVDLDQHFHLLVFCPQ